MVLWCSVLWCWCGVVLRYRSHFLFPWVVMVVVGWSLASLSFSLKVIHPLSFFGVLGPGRCHSLRVVSLSLLLYVSLLSEGEKSAFFLSRSPSII